MKSCGHSRYAKFCSEECQLKAHDKEHVNPLEWVGECEICDGYVKNWEDSNDTAQAV